MDALPSAVLHARGMNAMHGPVPGTHTAPPGALVQLPGSEVALIGLAALAVVMIPRRSVTWGQACSGSSRRS
jgi:hypothetical protein